KGFFHLFLAMFIPKGSSIEFGTPSTVRFLYVAWPANWQSL
ncbi:hypothetical protein FK514_28065, partial [Klebsiella pneumoniae]|nr:hypothetical protein [Klebsiella pneumoniae]